MCRLCESDSKSDRSENLCVACADAVTTAAYDAGQGIPAKPSLVAVAERRQQIVAWRHDTRLNRVAGGCVVEPPNEAGRGGTMYPVAPEPNSPLYLALAGDGEPSHGGATDARHRRG